ncbi:MAG TPA: VWA domain-containing protein [Hydrogenophaga sp.]|uniref:VWA domain-containing protein n=1 Tax=Hydrogenophaga sp. TaxID=1904254 RepID=UPI002C643B5A|nr:VWA domain-containing protein [Hydrogenophaga sp.]HSX91565.1 VWA domain-containing protein [Hydrogenophaga sp.]
MSRPGAAPPDLPGQVRALAHALWGGQWRVEWRGGAKDAAQRAVIVVGRDGGGHLGDGNDHGEAERAHDAAAVLHLPAWAEPAPDLSLAIAAHAAAHRRFGGEAQARAGLKPVQQALLGVLEDARVEWLAAQELPGLRAVWWSFHTEAAARQGSGFEDLLARLAASLLNPDHDDPHAWVAKVRREFFAPDGGLALDTPARVREAASRLGHDIGQMRLPFNARTYTVSARYRDDNSHLWRPDDEPPRDEAPLNADAAPPSDDAPSASPTPVALEPDAIYPEWDHRIARYRPGWCRVFGGDPPAGEAAPPPRAERHRLQRRLARLSLQRRAGGGRCAQGEELHPAALVEARLDRLAGRTPEARVYRSPQRPAPPLAVLLLLDASASTEGEPLAQLQRGALATVQALRALGHRCALWAFSSRGRHRIDMPCLRHWDEHVLARLPALRGGGSTRMGAALRHALHLSALDQRRHPGRRRLIVLLSDGEPHDVDVHDPAYLPADLQRAAREAEGRGVGVRALVLAPGEAATLAAALGRASVRICRSSAQWPAALAALLAASPG